ncbi:MAG: hypothetical protein WDZ52_05750 [Pseudohongiellaceae bacterium]
MSETTVNKKDVPYMEKTRNFYRAQGYDKDYLWAQHEHVPFRRLHKPLSDCKLALISTAMPDTPEGRADRKVYSCPVDPIPTSMYTDELSWHKTMTHTNDVATFLPLAQLQQCVKDNRLAALADRFHTIPTEYSQRNTLHKDAPEILSRCIDDEVDVAILVPL